MNKFPRKWLRKVTFFNNMGQKRALGDFGSQSNGASRKSADIVASGLEFWLL